MKEILNFINGEFISTGVTFNKYSPINNSIIAKVHAAGKEEVDAAVEAAKAAMKGIWANFTISKRIELLYAVADKINKRFDEFLHAECADTGKPYQLASTFDIPYSAANFRTFADIVKITPTECFETPTPDGRGAINYSIRRPVGVIGVVCPWNLPLLLLSWKVGPALACGNTVIVKPSEITPQTATLLGEIMNEVGMPKGVYNVVHGSGCNSAGEFVTNHPDIDAITFVGGPQTGSTIMKAAANGVKSVSMEMGGKNPSIIFSDCDFLAAIEGTMRSIYINCGQVCLCTERIYVERPIYDQFVKAMKEKTEALKIGVPENDITDMGPLVSLEHQQKVLSYYQKAKDLGATVVTGGGIPQMPGKLADGAWIEPTLWTGLDDHSVIAREEIFGPCALIQPFDSEEEVINRANDTKYGLACSLWTKDLQKAHRVSTQINAGMIWVNSWFLRDFRTPFGGSKESGIGREGGVHSLDFYTELRNICIKL